MSVSLHFLFKFSLSFLLYFLYFVFVFVLVLLCLVEGREEGGGTFKVPHCVSQGRDVVRFMHSYLVGFKLYQGTRLLHYSFM